MIHKGEFPCARPADLDLTAQVLLLENLRRGSGQPALPREQIIAMIVAHRPTAET